MTDPTVAVSLAAGVYACLRNGLLVMYFYRLCTDLYTVYYGFVVVMNATPIIVAAVAVVNDTIPVQQAPSGKKLKKRPKGKSE